MNLPDGFTHLSVGSTYLSENDLAKLQQLAPQPVQPAPPVQMAQPLYYAVQPQPQPQPQQRQYVFLPLKLDPKKADSETGAIFFATRNNLIDSFSKILNDAGVAWVDGNTGKDNNGIQVRQPVNLSDEEYKEINKSPFDE